MYGLLTPREPVNEKLGWLDNPKNMGLLHAALGILANNSGHYGALAPALGTGGLLGLQAAMGTQQQNVQNRRNNRRDARQDYFNREEMDLRKKEFGLMQQEAGLWGQSEYGQPQPVQTAQAAPAIAPQQSPQQYSEAGFQGQLAATGEATAPEVEVTATPLMQMEQYRRMAETAYARAQRNAPFGSNKKVKAMIDADMAAAKSYADKADRLEAKLEQTTVGGIPGVTFNKTDGKFYENGAEITAARVQELANRQAKSGASNVTQTASLKGGESILKELGPMISESRTEAMGAVEVVDAAQRIKKAAESGDLIAGPGAKWIMKGAQLADVLGIGGKDTAARIASTRQAIRGLAESTIAFRKKLKGQGQVTEYEQKTLEKAYSGDIDSMTTEEIKTIANLNIRLGGIMYKNHQDQLENMRKSEDPNIRGAVPFYSVPELPAGTLPEGWKVERTK